MEEAEIYYVDTRNATRPGVDHRPGIGSPGTATPPRVVVPTSTQRVTYAGGPAPGVMVSVPGYPPSNMGLPPNPYYGYGQNPMYMQPPPYGTAPFLGTLGALFGGINIGQVIDLVGQGFAALKALPAAPSSTGDVATDVANMTLYQRALAEHGKLDEQIRTGVHIVAKLLGA